MKQPDRYTVIIDIAPEDLPKHIKSAESLGLFWFARGEYRRTSLYLFFDELGMDNYLKGLYDQQAAERPEKDEK